MADRERPQTLSRAFLSLSRINSAESPIDYGLTGFYKARQFSKISSHEKSEAKESLQRFEEFCIGLRAIEMAEQKGDKDFPKVWIVQKNRNEKLPHIEIFLTARSLSCSLGKKLMGDWSKKLDDLKTIAEKTIEEKVEPAQIDYAIITLKTMHGQVKDFSEKEKKTSEKILSGRTLLT
jgi:hypothetical protein